MIRKFDRWLMIGITVAACACAGPGGPRGQRPGGGLPGGGASMLIFVSPMGEPFRVADRSESALDAWFNAADADGDGALSLAEFQADAQRFFGRLDANGDRTATSTESTEIYRREAPEVLAAGGGAPAGGMRPAGPPRGRGGPPPGGGGGGREPGSRGPPRGGGDRAGMGSRMGPTLQGAQRFGLLGDVEPVMSCDTDLSRRVTQSEFDACLADRFAALDSSDDQLFQRTEARLWRERAGPPRN